jgi:DNA-binding GntR family transcriptional regulator
MPENPRATARLREVEPAGALDVSRGPVREALLRLERERVSLLNY